MIWYPDKQRHFFLIAGPCVVENEKITFEIADTIAATGKKLDIPCFFKSSYRKANRSSLSSFTGMGDKEALAILKEVKKRWHLPIVTDVHAATEVECAAEVADVIQIPAFLCRQTDLLLAAGHSGKIVNIKKGQFLSPEAMQYAVDKVRSTGNNKIFLTERGTTFGYQDLIVDFRGIKALKATGCPCVLDCTHALQKPNQPSGVTGGCPDLIEIVAKAGIAVGFDGLFMETHPYPAQALSDGANMLPLHELEPLLRELLKIRHAILPE
ncbi:MAG: 3-deoxy-8-phosphooctulonate synthase [Bacteroidales bacterium]|jgi:2-dehydro-3-deoxyphosphooctonate aldolase (KDO 8-P synthase)|nr:3-deoxy-8-phosphooctulonate synthase [Bacteroidales bacterium]